MVSRHPALWGSMLQTKAHSFAQLAHLENSKALQGRIHVKHAQAAHIRPNPTNKIVQFVSHVLTQASLQLDVERHRRDIVLIALLGSMSISLFKIVLFAPEASTRPNPTNKIVRFVSHVLTQASLQ